ncbi:hypothetical protein K439DRAFT_1623163 [Ramaria rubella]|nr:hypothetical protein K439DRAFT_1623163 [Ramaria rubella]
MSVDEDALYLQHLRAICVHINLLKASRILKLNKVYKLSQLYIVLEAFKNEDPKWFCQNLCVSPETFDILVTHIEDSHVFISQGPNAQLLVHEQLVIALFRFSHFGNSALVESIAQWAGVAAGTVVNSTPQVIVVFLVLHNKVIHWPNTQEKEAAKQWVESVSCAAWHDGFCFVDGTLVPLADKPGYHGEAYFDRKSNYLLNVQIINLPNLCIIDYVIGHCGRAHDSTTFHDSCVYHGHCHLFRNGEWIWADSAYPVQLWCVSPYKRPAAD